MLLRKLFKEIRNARHGRCELKYWMQECVGDQLPGPPADPVIESFDGDPIAKVFCLKAISEWFFERYPYHNRLLLYIKLDEFLDTKRILADPIDRLYGFSNTIAMNLLGATDADSSMGMRFVRLMNCETLRSYCYEPHVRTKPIRSPIFKKEQAEALRKGIEQLIDAGINPCNFRTFLPLYWFTKESELMSLGISPLNRLDWLNAFGIEVLDGQFWLPVFFAKSTEVHPKTPTFFEASDIRNVLFIPANPRDGWGKARRTCDLTPSVSEAISAEMSWPNHSTIGAEIGPTSASKTPKEGDWRKVLEELTKEFCHIDKDFNRDFILEMS